MNAREETGTGTARDGRRHSPDLRREGPLRALRPAPLLLLGCLGILPLQAAADVTPAGGEEPPRLALRSLQGEPRSLKDLRGRIVVLNFWATWCIPCREEMPVLVKVKERYGRRGVEIIGASADDREDLDKVRRFRGEQGLNFPVWTGATIPDMMSLGLGEALPATAILDREGRAAFRIRGPVTLEQIASRLDFILEGGTGAPPPRDLDSFADHGPERSRSAGGAGDGEAPPGSSGSVESGQEEARGRDGGPGEEGAGAAHDHGEDGTHRHPEEEDDASLVPS